MWSFPVLHEVLICILSMWDVLTLNPRRVGMRWRVYAAESVIGSAIYARCEYRKGNEARARELGRASIKALTGAGLFRWMFEAEEQTAAEAEKHKTEAKKWAAEAKKHKAESDKWAAEAQKHRAKVEKRTVGHSIFFTTFVLIGMYVTILKFVSDNVRFLCTIYSFPLYQSVGLVVFSLLFLLVLKRFPAINDLFNANSNNDENQ